MPERDKDVYQQFAQMYDEIHKRIVGEEETIRDIIIAIFGGGHVLIESVPGMGKTMLAKTISETLDCDFKRIQCTADLRPTDIIGKMAFDEAKKKYVLSKGPIFTNILLIDEINRAPPKTQSALLEAMAEKNVTIGGESYKVTEPFIVLATENPVEQEGTFPLPEAQKDRFLFKSVIKYLPMEEEIAIVKSKAREEKINKIFNPPEILIIREEIAKTVSISDAILEYVVKIVDATRERREVATGASPRASIAFMTATKTKAFLEGRNHVTAKDIKEMALPILRHRLILNPDSADFGVTPDDVITKVLERIEAPAEKNV